MILVKFKAFIFYFEVSYFEKKVDHFVTFLLSLKTF